MAKKDETVTEDQVETVNQPSGAPVAPDAFDAVANRETLSHQWQKDSPALNTNVLAGYAVQENLVEKMLADAAAEDVKPEKADMHISQSEFDRRTKLDVAHPDYINASLTAFKVK